MRPVRGADFQRGHIKRAELVSVRDCDGVLRDVLLCRMIFESIQRPDGGLREATRENLATPKPNAHGRHHVGIQAPRVDADFIRKQTHPQQPRFEDRCKSIVYVDLLRRGISSSKIESELKHLLVIRWRQLRHRIDDRALYGQ